MEADVDISKINIFLIKWKLFSSMLLDDLLLQEFSEASK